MDKRGEGRRGNGGDGGGDGGGDHDCDCDDWCGSGVCSSCVVSGMWLIPNRTRLVDRKGLVMVYSLVADKLP